MLRRIWSFAVAVLIGLNTSAFSYELVDHPRIFITKADLPGLAQRSKGVLKGEYAKVKAVADSVLKTGVAKTDSRFRPPVGLICSGLCYLVERELGGNAEPYAGTIRKYWGEGAVLALNGDGYFGYNGMLYDWIYDALSDQEREKIRAMLVARAEQAYSRWWKDPYHMRPYTSHATRLVLMRDGRILDDLALDGTLQAPRLALERAGLL